MMMNVNRTPQLSRFSGLKRLHRGGNHRSHEKKSFIAIHDKKDGYVNVVPSSHLVKTLGVKGVNRVEIGYDRDRNEIAIMYTGRKSECSYSTNNKYKSLTLRSGKVKKITGGRKNVEVMHVNGIPVVIFKADGTYEEEKEEQTASMRGLLGQYALTEEK